MVGGGPDEGPQGYWLYNGWDDAEIASDLPVKTYAFFAQNTDSEPDMFFFNFAGNAGRFIVDVSPDHNARFIPYNNMKLTHTSLV